jgi:protein TonB
MVRFSERPSMLRPAEPEVEAPPPPRIAEEPTPVPAPESVGAFGPEPLPAEPHEPIAEMPPPASPPPAEHEPEPPAAPATPPAEPAPAPPSPPAAPEAKDSTKVDASPLPGHNPTPPYPFVAWRRRIEGTVLVSLRIDATGAVIEGHVARSSGSAMLDDAALTTLKTWKFAPARDAFGVHESTHEREVVFRIRS